VQKRLAAGEDFGVVAKEASEDVSAERGGDLGWVEVATGRAEFIAAVQGVSTGQVAEPVELNEGVYVLRLADMATAELRALDDTLRGEIEAKLRRERQRERYEGFVGELRQKFYVKTFFGVDKK